MTQMSQGHGRMTRSEGCRSCRSSRRGRAVLSSTTACTAPRTRWRSSRARCRSGPSFLASFEARLHVFALYMLCASLRLRGCLGRVRRCACRVSCPASAANSWPSARRSRRAHQISAARWAHAGHTRFAQLGLRLRGSRQARVPHVVCVRVWSHAVQRVFCVFCVCCVSP